MTLKYRIIVIIIFWLYAVTVVADGDKRFVSNIAEMGSFERIVITTASSHKTVTYISINPCWNDVITKFYECNKISLNPVVEEQDRPLIATKTTCDSLSTVVPSKALYDELKIYALKSDKMISSFEHQLILLSKNSKDILCSLAEPHPKDRTFYAQWALGNSKPLLKMLKLAKKQQDCAAVLIEFLEYKIWIIHCANDQWIFMLGLYGEIHPDIAIKNGYLIDARMLKWFGEKGKCLPITKTMWADSWAGTAQVTLFWGLDGYLLDCLSSKKLVIANDLKNLPDCKPNERTIPTGTLVFSEDALK